MKTLFLLIFILVGCVNEQGEEIISPKQIASFAIPTPTPTATVTPLPELDKSEPVRASFSHLDIAENNDDYDVILVFGSSLLLNTTAPDFGNAPSSNLFYTDLNPTNIFKMTRYMHNIAGEQANILSTLDVTKKTIIIPVIYTESFEDVIGSFYYSWAELKYAIPQWLLDKGVEVDALVTCFGENDTNHLNDRYDDFMLNRWDNYANNLWHLCENATTPSEAAAEFENLLN